MKNIDSFSVNNQIYPIENIEVNGVLYSVGKIEQEKLNNTIVKNHSGITIVPDAGKTLNKVTVNVDIPTQTKTINIVENGNSQEFLPSPDMLIDKVIVNANVLNGGGSSSTKVQTIILDNDKSYQTTFNPGSSIEVWGWGQTGHGNYQNNPQFFIFLGKGYSEYIGGTENAMPNLKIDSNKKLNGLPSQSQLTEGKIIIISQ